jgi:RNA-directed DNA polymerase
VLRALRGCYARLALKVNESKTAVAEVWGRKFLGYCLYVTKGYPLSSRDAGTTGCPSIW